MSAKRFKKISDELLAGHKINSLTEREFLMNELLDRVCEFSKPPRTGFRKVTYNEAVYTFENIRDLADLAKDLAIRYQIPGIKGPNSEFNFNFPTYDEFHLQVQTIQKAVDVELQKQSNIRKYSSDKNNLTRKGGEEDTEPNSWSTLIIIKLLAALGLGVDGAVAIMTLIMGSGEWALFRLALSSGSGALIREALVDLLRMLFGRSFMARMIGVLGRRAAAKFAALMSSKLLPFVGWALIIGAFLIAIYEEWDEIMELIDGDNGEETSHDSNVASVTSDVPTEIPHGSGIISPTQPDNF